MRTTPPHLLPLLALTTLTTPALAQDGGFSWATIGDVNNPAYGGGPFGELAGRGSVSYAYRISRLEITTGQWMEYVNTFSTQSDDLRYFSDPDFWGARPDPTYTGPGRRWTLRDVPGASMLPVAGISWREAGRYCNWLHNAKRSDLSSLDDGAYDTSTWGNDGSLFTDAFEHRPDARFWIPTLDEWLKAAHYDPSRHGPGRGGWWEQPNGSDTPLAAGLPGQGQTMAGLELPGWAHWNVPLGAYPEVRSPWGLLDLSGGAAEWLEEVYFPSWPTNRGVDGSWNGQGAGYESADSAWGTGGLPPSSRGSIIGLRIAAAVPSPSAGSLAVVVTASFTIRRRRRS